jgi:hypothetical protein
LGAGDGYAKPVLVSTDWLDRHRTHAGVVVAEVDEDPDRFDAGALFVLVSNSAATPAPARATCLSRQSQSACPGLRACGTGTATGWMPVGSLNSSRRCQRQFAPPVATLLPRTDDERRLVTILGAEPYSG